ncbi:MAG: haloacid dehalogenase-like hydrolase [Prevotella sp.]|nr:haloacid dehalogenase-like hydrolase [Prevotella sp.]
MKVHAFDFDGTLTRRDTLVEFIRYVKGDMEFLKCFLRYSPQLVAMKVGLYPNWKVKRQVFSYCFAGMKEEVFNDFSTRFAHAKSSLMRPAGVEKIRSLLQDGCQVVVVSASVENWVRPFFGDLSDAIQFLCTRVEVKDGVLTGRFLTKNCFGKEKVARLRTLYPDRRAIELTAYGDSRGDREMLDYANEGYYRPFR